jgi:hypothetical protein
MRTAQKGAKSMKVEKGGEMVQGSCLKSSEKLKSKDCEKELARLQVA